jgi:excisionase family DNA binding protein
MPRPRTAKAEQAPIITALLSADASAGIPSSADPRAFGLVKAAYSVREVVELLSIGRTSLYAAVRRGELKRVKLGKRTLFCATDLAAFLVRLRSQETRPAAVREA